MVAAVGFPNTEAGSELSAYYTQALSLKELEYTLAFPASMLEFSASYRIMYIVRTEDIMWRWHLPLRIPV